jgi:hypothetical protein
MALDKMPGVAVPAKRVQSASHHHRVIPVKVLDLPRRQHVDRCALLAQSIADHLSQPFSPTA